MEESINEITISWDESGTKTENIVDVICIGENDNKYQQVILYGNNKLIVQKKHGAHNPSIPCLKVLYDNSLTFSFYKRHIFLLTLKNSNNEYMDFYNLGFLNINIDINGKKVNYVKKITENQEGSVFHIGNIEEDGSFTEIFDYISSVKVLQKQLKVKI